MKIEIEVSEQNEYTSSPWWIIIDPSQNFKTNEDGACNIVSMITGPFFSRKDAEDVLSARRNNYSRNAVVYCHSGCYSGQYDKAYRGGEAMFAQRNKQKDNL